MKRSICFLATIFFFSVLFAQEDTTLQQYTGTYKFPEGSVVTSVEIVVLNGALSANSSMGSAALEKVSKDTFNLPSYNGMVYFSRDSATHKVSGIKIEVQDIVLEGKKEEKAAAYANIFFIRENTFFYSRNEAFLKV